MPVRFRVFRSSTMMWDTLFQQAAVYAGELGPERLISISHSCDHSEGVVTVWYWDTTWVRRTAEDAMDLP